MDNRTKLLTKINLKQDLRTLLILLAVIFAVALGVPSLFSLSIKFDFSFFINAYAICILLLPWISFDDRFRQVLQNGFSRAQLFKAKMLTTLPWIILLTIITLATDSITVKSEGSSYHLYNNYFQNPIVNVALVVILQFCSNLFAMWVVQFLGAFFAIFSRNIRKYMVIIIFAATLIFIIGVFLGGVILVEEKMIDPKLFLASTKLFAEVVLGYNGTAYSFNPINPIVSCIIFTGIMMYLTRFIILRLQLHRES
ncbi:hypothetical protein ACYATM_04795 [Lactobacillaceae bacterium Scapto_B20]